MKLTSDFALYNFWQILMQDLGKLLWFLLENHRGSLLFCYLYSFCVLLLFWFCFKLRVASEYMLVFERDVLKYLEKVRAFMSICSTYSCFDFGFIILHQLATRHNLLIQTVVLSNYHINDLSNQLNELDNQ